MAEQVTGLAEQLAALQEEVAKLRAVVTPDAFYVTEVEGTMSDGSIEIACDKETDILLSYDCSETQDNPYTWQYCPVTLMPRLRSDQSLGSAAIEWTPLDGNYGDYRFTITARCLAVEE